MLTHRHVWTGVVCVVASACWQEPAKIDGTFTEDEWAFLSTEFRLPEPVDCVEPFLAKNLCGFAAELGRELFFDKSLGGQVLIKDAAAPGPFGSRGNLACASCHDPNSFFVDTRSQPRNISIGAAKLRTKHNAMSVLNLAYKEAQAAENCLEADDPVLCARVFSWTGKYPDAGSVFLIAGPNAMNIPVTGEQATFALRVDPSRDYVERYFTLFGGVPEDCVVVDDPADKDSPIDTFKCSCPPTQTRPCHPPAEVFGNLSKVFDAYLRKLSSVGSPFDKYIAQPVVDDHTAEPVDKFGDAERRGLAIFIGKGMCVDCHRGPMLSDLKFHNTGVPQIGPNVREIDGGLGDEPEFGPDLTRLGEFLTPPLRHVAKTSPYMHAGQLDSLSAVIEFYRDGGIPEGFSGRRDPRIQPLEIDDDEARDLEAFLRSLTGNDDKDGYWAAPVIQ